MLTRLLHSCGLYLGPESALMPAQADNPDGFWEHLGFVAALGKNPPRYAEFDGPNTREADPTAILWSRVDSFPNRPRDMPRQLLRIICSFP
jgi:hypothetical protein